MVTQAKPIIIDFEKERLIAKLITFLKNNATLDEIKITAASIETDDKSLVDVDGFEKEVYLSFISRHLRYHRDRGFVIGTQCILEEFVAKKLQATKRG